MLKTLKEMLLVLKNIENLISGKDDTLSEFEKQYQEYRTFADARGMKLLSEAGLVDEYNSFMTKAEEILFSNEYAVGYTLKIELPKPSGKLEAFKNKFNKFFK